MPTFRITVEKFMSSMGEYWTNVYHAPGTVLADVATVATAIVNAEKALYPNTVVITKTRVDDMTPNTDVYATTILNTLGSRASLTGELVPLFVTARADFTIAGGGRPSRKYLRAVLTEDGITMSSISANYGTMLQTYIDAIVASGTCDVDGQDVAGGAPFMAPQMRQLRRGSKKKVIP